MTEIATLDAAQVRAAIPELAAVLVDCVAGGASVNFMAGYSQVEAEAFFAKAADDVAAGATVLLTARIDRRIVGTVQLGLDTPPNQPHRAEIKKMLVHRDARRRGVGAALMTAVEDAARAAGRTLLVLDTVTGMDGERLYARMGWICVGDIPGYALMPDGEPCSTTVFYKRVD